MKKIYAVLLCLTLGSSSLFAGLAIVWVDQDNPNHYWSVIIPSPTYVTCEELFARYPHTGVPTDPPYVGFCQEFRSSDDEFILYDEIDRITGVPYQIISSTSGGVSLLNLNTGASQVLVSPEEIINRPRGFEVTVELLTNLDHIVTSFRYITTDSDVDDLFDNKDYVTGVKLFQTSKMLTSEPLIEVSLYPNPSNGLINLNVSTPPVPFEEQLTVEIFDNQGKLAYRSKIYDGPNNINLADVADGMYFYRVFSDKKGYIHRGRFVLQ